MTIQSIVKMGNINLAKPAIAVSNFNTPDIKQVLQDMKDTMHAKGGVGIAAPQIGVSLRIIMFGFDTNPRYPDEKPVPFTVLMNPSFEVLSPQMVHGWEGCLSVPGLRGLVPRYEKIRYHGFDPNGQTITRVAEGFHARVVQHEYDHIEGILYPQRMQDLSNFGFEDELREIIWPNQNKL